MSDEQGTKEMKLSKGEILFGGTALLWLVAWMAVVLVAWVVS